MADQLTHVHGLKDLQTFLDELPAKMEKNIMRGAMRAGMKPVLAQAEQNVPVDTGAMRYSLKVGTRAEPGRVTAFVKTEDFMARWVEFGTKAHFIKVADAEKPVNARLSKLRGTLVRASMTTVNRNVLRIGTKFVGPTIWHPGAKPHPFLRPALDQQAAVGVIHAAEYIKGRLGIKDGINIYAETLEGDE